MSMRYPGGLIATSPVNARYPSGVWTQAQAAPYQAQNVWTRDQFWPYTTLLLQGDGAVNGAQNNTFLDSSSNNFTITRNGNTTQGSFTPYEQDGYWSNYFSGSGDVNAPSNAAFTYGTSDFTIEGWFFITGRSGPNSYEYLFAQGSSTGTSSLGLYREGGVLKVWNGSTVITGTTTLALNTWNHIALSRSGTTMRLFLNGVQEGSATNSNSISTGSTYGISVGRWTEIDTNYIVGYVSNFRVVKGTAVYASAFTPSAAPLTAITNTSLLTCQSNRFKDNSTNNFTLTVNGSPSVQAFQPFPGATTWSASVLGGSGYFDGTGDYLTAPSGAVSGLGTGDYTIEGWYYPTSFAIDTLYRRLWSFGSGLSDSLSLTIDDGTISAPGRLVLRFNDTIRITSSSSAALNAWNHIAVVRSSGTTTIYLNGSSVGTSATSDNLNTAGSSSLSIGAQAGTSQGSWLGFMGNMRVVKGTAVYTSAFTPPTAPLTAITNTSFLANFTNAGIYDNSMMNNLETVGNAQVSTSVVKYGTGSMAFDGSGDYLKYLGTNVAGLGSGNFTIEFWINAPSLNDKFILGLRGGMSGSPHVTTGGYGGTTVGALRWASSAGEILSGTTVITDNTWHHCAIVRNGSTITLYVDGISRGSGTDTTAFNGNGGQILIGENDLGTNTFTGYLDDLRITRGVARYLTSFTPPPARMPGQ